MRIALTVRGMTHVKTLRTRLLIGLLPTLAILVALGLWAVGMFYRLGGNIDRILRENYRSVLAAEGMKESLERMDSGLLFAIVGQEDRGREQFARYRLQFEEQLRIEQGNITLGGEQELADELDRLFRRYLSAGDRFFAMPASTEVQRIGVYFDELLPAIAEIRERADQVLTINQDNMTAMDLQAARMRRVSTRLMIGVLLGSIAMAIAAALWPESFDRAADPGGDGGSPRRCRGASWISSSRRRRGTSWASWPTPSTRWPDESASTAGRDGPAAACPEDGAGDDRLVPRPGGGRRSARRGRAGQSGGAPASWAWSRPSSRRCPGVRRHR